MPGDGEADEPVDLVVPPARRVEISKGKRDAAHGVVVPQVRLYPHEPVLLDSAVVVREGDDVAARGIDAGVPARGEFPVAVEADDPHVVHPRERLRRPVRRGVVNDDNLVVRIPVGPDTLHAVAEEGEPVVREDNDADHAPFLLPPPVGGDGSAARSCAAPRHQDFS